MKLLFITLMLTMSLIGCDVNANKVNKEGDNSNLYLSKMSDILTSQNEEEKRDYFDKIMMEAERGNSVAQNLMGVIFENGYFNQEKDIKKAIYWYNKAVDNNGLAENNMSGLYAYGNGVKQDYKKAYEYYESAMKKNIPEAINSIGFMYFNGFYLRQDYKKACEYYEKSADLGYYPAQSNLANCYSNGWNGPVNQKIFLNIH
ncbi:tetratricopeptide repeat protein [Acinetobacter colistiniresistens]|uniref:tetratricopeptide repeat protein n=1 Tax=Acinetobacter colistiniresistens TaxID=280145 RepID=UPI002FE172EF